MFDKQDRDDEAGAIEDPDRSSGEVVGWVLSVCPAAGEAGGSFRNSLPKPPAQREYTTDPDRSAREAARRAKAKIRRYCAANRLNRLGTLTYAGEGCHDPHKLRDDVAGFFRRLREGRGGRPFPYVWVSEWHKTGHGLHVHFALGDYTKRSLIESAWGRGFVHIKLLGDLGVGSGRLGEARKAAGYLAKYAGKSVDDERRIAGLHRYEVGEGFQPDIVQVWGATCSAAIRRACDLMGGTRPEVFWLSADTEGWQGPPAVWLAWPG